MLHRIFLYILLAPGFGKAWLLSIQLCFAHDALRSLHRHHGRNDRFPFVSPHHDVEPNRQALYDANSAHGDRDHSVHVERPFSAGEHFLSGSGGPGGELRAAVPLLLHEQQAQLGDLVSVPAFSPRFSQQFRRFRVLPGLHALPLLAARAFLSTASL